MSLNFYDANLDKPLTLDFTDLINLSQPLTQDLLNKGPLTTPVYRKTDAGYYFIFPDNSLYNMIKMKYNISNSFNPKFFSLSNKSTKETFSKVSLKGEDNISDAITDSSPKKPISEVFTKGPSIVFFGINENIIEKYGTEMEINSIEDCPKYSCKQTPTSAWIGIMYLIATILVFFIVFFIYLIKRKKKSI